MKMPLFIFLLILAASCGEKRKESATSSKAQGPVERMFVETALRYNIPVRFLLGVAMMESNMTSNRSSANYQDQSQSLSISLGETAFGLSYKKLGIPEDPANHTLQIQLESYARLIKSSMESKGLNLPVQPSQAADKFEWIWHLAQVHRGGLDSRRNIQVVFALELMDFLNHGHTWQDLSTGEVIELTKENPAFEVENFPNHVRDSLKLFTAPSDIYAAEYFELTYQRPNDARNVPDHIRVIHCPFTLSACLEMQNPLEEADGVRLNAHYIIPQTPDLVKKPLQVAQHEQVLFLTDNEGIPESVQDAIVVMLVGESGRYVEGTRLKAKPTWFTKYQLNQMGTIIRNLCPIIKQMNSAVDVEKCIKPGLNGGVFFRHQGNSDEFQWGDIPDYDESIFWPYIDRPDSLEGGVSIEFNSPQKIYAADREIVLKMRFRREAAKIILQQAERCSNQKLIWTVLQNKRVRNATESYFGFTLYYQGPNGNGEQFLRAMVYDIEGKLLGWGIEDLVLTNYSELNGPGASLRECQRNGT